MNVQWRILHAEMRESAKLATRMTDLSQKEGYTVHSVFGEDGYLVAVMMRVVPLSTEDER